MREQQRSDGLYLVTENSAHPALAVDAAVRAFYGRELPSTATGLSTARAQMIEALDAWIALYGEPVTAQAQDTTPTRYEVWRDAVLCVFADADRYELLAEPDGIRTLIERAEILHDILTAGPPEA